MKGIEIVFFRHGIAADTVPDRNRNLTEEGIRKTYSAAEGLKKMEIPFDRIFTSPWLRAVQTAAILSEVLMLAKPEEMPELAGDHTAGELLEALRKSQGNCFLLVGHQPLLGDAVSALLGAEGRCEIDLKKSGACFVHVDALPPKKPAFLKWLMTSRQLRAAGKMGGG